MILKSTLFGLPLSSTKFSIKCSCFNISPRKICINEIQTDGTIIVGTAVVLKLLVRKVPKENAKVLAPEIAES